jgi:hypothetical protein
MGHCLPKGEKDPTKWTKKVCDWCGKEKELRITDANNGKVFFTCSRSCRGHMVGLMAKERWANYTPEQRKALVEKMHVGNSYTGEALVEYHRSQRPDRVAKFIMMTSAQTRIPKRKTSQGAYVHSKPATNPRLHADEWLPRGTCTVIAAHHEMLKDDPDRLTTDFMEKMCGVKCRCRVGKDNKQEVIEAEMTVDEVFERLSE